MSKLESWYKKENGYGIIGCQYIDGDDKEEKIITDCAMITPEKKLLNIEQHPASGRYDPLGTNFTKKICQVEVNTSFSSCIYILINFCVNLVQITCSTK